MTTAAYSIRRGSLIWLTMTALFMGMNIILSLSIFSIPVPGGHLYFCDVVINTAAMLLDSLISRKVLFGKQAASSVIGVTVGAIIMTIGYTLGRAYVYSTPEYAILKLPFEILQAGFGAAVAILLLYPMGLRKLFEKTVRR